MQNVKGGYQVIVSEGHKSGGLQRCLVSDSFRNRFIPCFCFLGDFHLYM